MTSADTSDNTSATDSHLQLARKQIQFARDYTLTLLADVAAEDWFQMPAGANTHLAWQVGHLAMAEYGLTLLRIRGKQPSDSEFITNDFIRCFKKGSSPTPDPAAYPEMGEIRGVFDAVHKHALQVMESYTDDQLGESLPAPTAAYDTKLGSLLFCSAHEMLHAGQIGFLRRMLGKEPVR